MPFNNGVTGLTWLTVQEYPWLCLLTMVTIDGLLGDPVVEKAYAKLLWLSISLKKLLTELQNTKTMLIELEMKIIKFLLFMKNDLDCTKKWGHRVVFKFQSFMDYYILCIRFASLVALLISLEDTTSLP